MENPRTQLSRLTLKLSDLPDAHLLPEEGGRAVAPRVVHDTHHRRARIIRILPPTNTSHYSRAV